MSLDSFGNQLKSYRLEKHVSLQEVSAKTKISLRLLEAMEGGQFSLLPQPYIRAFIREYAHAVEADSEELLRQYDAGMAGPKLPAVKPAAPSETVPEAPGEIQPQGPTTGPHSQLWNRIITGVIVLIPIAIISLILLQRGDPEPEPVKEIPFDRAVEENEARISEANKPGTVQQQTISQPVPGDSLRLEIATTDSVWMSLTIDNIRRGEYLFPPNFTRSWSGKDQFVVSVGNAGAALFRLNGKEIGPLGKPGAIARSVLITARGILLPE
ncbi:MAG: RodZ domain-containing protein [bacterium]